MNEAVRPQAIPGLGEWAPKLDYVLLLAVVALLSLGVVMVTSASMHKVADAPFYYTQKHLMALLLGVAAGLLAMRIPMARLQRFGPWFYFLGLVLLSLVLIPGVGREVNGATRWIPIAGFNFQSSEFMKLFMVIYIAGYLVRRQKEVAENVWAFVNPMVLVLIAGVLIMLEPDFGTTVVLMTTVLGMLFLGGVPVGHFSILIGMLSVAMGLLVWFEPYRLQRVTSFMDPWADPLDAGFQLTQALIAFGRGEWTGVGLGGGIQKLFYLPEAHTDFVMAVVAEELGLLATLTIIALFAVVTWRAFSIGVAAEAMGRRFSAYVAYGFGLWISMQALINIGVNVGMLPTKGLTLPFLSYGSNSVIAACLIVGMLLRIDRENRHGPDTREEPAWATE